MHRNQSVSTHKFAMVPKADIPRSSFNIQKGYKTTFNSGLIIPIYVDEVLPGDSFRFNATMFARLATPLFPTMDNLKLDTFFFFVPNRLVWSNWQKFMGEQENPGDSTSYTIPQCPTPVGGWPIGSTGDYLGLPTVGQLGSTATIKHSALPLRGINLIYNEWFRDENLQDSVPVPKGDADDDPAIYPLYRRGKRKDYFTGALPWPQKGESVTVPLGTKAPINWESLTPGIGNKTAGFNVDGSNITKALYDMGPEGTGGNLVGSNSNMGMYADLSDATASTINQLRQSFQIQKLLERDARGGTRYTEIVLAHFGVKSADSRLQRPEFLGGGSTNININPIAQTSGTSVTGSDTPQGHLAAMGTALANGHGFTYSATEHGHILGFCSVRADLTYQQGLRRFWSRKTRYDFYFPVFAMLGEQTILNKEIYATGTPSDDDVFGYQERWAEYRYNPSEITGLFRSTAAGTLDGWHLAQHFTTLPTLGSTFIEEHPPVDRIVAVGDAANGQQFIMDCFYQINAARPLPMYSVPGLIDHF